MRNFRKQLSALVLLGFIMATAAFARWSAEPAAVVVSVTGGVQVQRSGQSAAAPATVGLNLNAGDKVIVASGGKATLLYKSGKLEPATATVTIAEPNTPQPQGMFKQAVETVAQVATTNARVQPNRQGMIRPVAGEPVPIAPRNGVKVIDVRPTFTWFKVAGASQYTVQIRRVNPAGGAPVRFQSSDTVFHYPSTTSPLVPGAEYEWTVGAGSGGRIGNVVRFKIVSGDEFNQIATTLRELHTAGVDPMGDGQFVMALAYREAGLFYEANRLTEQLSKSGTKGRIFFLLRGEVLDAIGDLDGASRAFQAADSESSN